VNGAGQEGLNIMWSVNIIIEEGTNICALWMVPIKRGQ